MFSFPRLYFIYSYAFNRKQRRLLFLLSFYMCRQIRKTTFESSWYNIKRKRALFTVTCKIKDRNISMLVLIDSVFHTDSKYIIIITKKAHLSKLCSLYTYFTIFSSDFFIRDSGLFLFLLFLICAATFEQLSSNVFIKIKRQHLFCSLLNLFNK